MGINTFNAGNANVLTSKQRSMQNGTPKLLESGIARACYAQLSYNTSTGTYHGAVMFDRYFQPVRGHSHMANFGNHLNSNDHNAMWFPSSGEYTQSGSQMFYSAAATQTQIATTASGSYLQATHQAGEFGNSMIDIFSNGTAAPMTTRSTSWTNKMILNHCFVDSDHADKAIVYILNGTTFRAVSRLDGEPNFDYYGTTSFAITGANANSQGTASYNAVRKELVILASTGGNGGAFNLITYQGIDFNKYPSPSEAFSAPGVTRTDKSIAAMPTSWPTNSAEAMYNAKPTLCDNGDIYVSTMHPSNTFVLHRIVRDASLNPTVTHLANKTLTTSYGREQNATYYGQRRLQSRDGGAVLAYCAYYYYGVGAQTYVIDKRKSAWVASTHLDQTGSADGQQCVPYGDSGFASYFAGNNYAGNPIGAYVTGTMERNNLGNLVQTGQNIALAYHTLPNTTNYPGFTQVVDYSMLDNQTLV